MNDPAPVAGDAAPTSRDAWTAAHCALFRELFCACGTSGVRGRSPAQQVLLTSLAGRFAWHAALLFDLLPVRVEVDREGLVARSASASLLPSALAPLVDDAEALCTALSDVVLPRLVDTVRAAAAATEPRLDGPRARALALIGRDLDDARAALEASHVASRVGFVDVERALERAMEDFGALAEAGRGT